MKEIKSIFAEVFKDHIENERERLISLFKENKTARATFVSIAFFIILINIFTINSLLQQIENNLLMIFLILSMILLSLFTFTAYLLICSLSKWFVEENYNERIQKEFLPKLTQEQIEFLVSEKAKRILAKDNSWDNLSYEQVLGLEQLSKSLTYENVLNILETETLKDLIRG